MAYISREDGERFIIPSYRDVLSVKKTSLLRREVMLLSQNYGEYIALQRKNVEQYEVAFSNEPGYLLGESVWNYFKRPQDLIYCEIIPNTFEAILVIVKSGIVYLDGSFPLDVIVDELVVFRSQQNNFEIYVYGDVPISQMLEEGKFSFDPSSVKSFTQLSEPIFPTLPTNKAFQLQLVETVLRARGIGVFPLKKVVIVFAIIALIWGTIQYFSTHKKALPRIFIEAVSPDQAYINALTSPSPTLQLKYLVDYIYTLGLIPGWKPDQIVFIGDTISTTIASMGGRTNYLYQWAKKHNASVEINPTGYSVVKKVSFSFRNPPQDVYKLHKVVSALTDSFSYVLPGNNFVLGKTVDRSRFLEIPITINVTSISPQTLLLIAEQLKKLPLVLTRVSLTVGENNQLTGSIFLLALGRGN